MKTKSGLQLKPWQCLTGNQIKIIGVIMMVFDHIYQMFYAQGAPLWMTCIGRLVAPIFLFMCAEGFFYTHSKKRYMLRLLIGFFFMNIASAAISSVFPSNVVLMNNIFSTLFVCTVYMLAIDFLKKGIKEKKAARIILAIILMLAPILTSILCVMLLQYAAVDPKMAIMVMMIPSLMTAEGGYIFVILGVLFYIFRKWRYAQAAALIIISIFVFILGDKVQSLMIFAVIPILMYNGQHGKGSKYFFYIFYPAHIYLLYLISYFIFYR